MTIKFWLQLALKELRNYVSRIICVCSFIFSNTGLSKVCIHQGVSFYLYVLYAFSCVMSVEFDVTFTELQHIIIAFISAIWSCVILLSLDEDFLFVKNHIIKIWF